MLGDCKPITFIPTKNPDGARSFYENTLGLSFVSDSPFALLFESGGISLRIAKMEKFQPAPFTIFGWRVENISSTVKHLSDLGVSFEFFDGLDQDQQGIWSTPDGSKIAWFKDPDGNLLSLTG